MAGPVDIEWSPDALADSSDSQHSYRSSIRNSRAVARAIIDKAQVLSAFPRLGRSIAGREEYRQLVLQVLNAPYVFQYRFDGSRLVILRVYHGREQRG
jgi:plasmid stabilization system protein ParE